MAEDEEDGTTCGAAGTAAPVLAADCGCGGGMGAIFSFAGAGGGIGLLSLTPVVVAFAGTAGTPAAAGRTTACGTHGDLTTDPAERSFRVAWRLVIRGTREGSPLFTEDMSLERTESTSETSSSERHAASGAGPPVEAPLAPGPPPPPSLKSCTDALNADLIPDMNASAVRIRDSSPQDSEPESKTWDWWAAAAAAPEDALLLERVMTEAPAGLETPPAGL